ncbi:MAG: 3D-(3,5/4)-trihydroxycyclohexane-1,2-dione acylhydrolase (decyclizing) [Clostridiaceae bacterium]|nr:3D-(3,5/4)-trihydroxycyclohexane-1,2-dione acylhydrolase (decyclizing) [Clostridiaceae bacterium]
MTKRIRLTMAQAIVKFLDNQYIEQDGIENKFVNGMFAIFGHGCVTGIGEALENMDHNLTFYQGKNEQGMALAAMAYSKQKDRKEIIPCVSSIGPGATNMVTAAACATANRIPLLVLPGDTFATRQPDPVLQQAEIFSSVGTTVNDSFKAVCRYFDRCDRPEQVMSALINAMRVLTDPADTGAVGIAMPQDVEAEAYDYPEYFFKKRVWHLDRRPITQNQIDRTMEILKESKRPLAIVGGGVRYSAAEKELIEFAEKANIPFGETQAGKGIIPWDHKLNLGGIGVTGTLAANRIAKEADLVIGIGTRFTDFTTSSKWLFQNPDVKFISLNICAFDAFKMDAEGIICDAKEGLKGLTENLGDYKSEYTVEIEENKNNWNKIVDEAYTEELEEGFSQKKAVGIINKFAKEQDVVVCAAGSLPGDLQRYWRPGDSRSYHVEYGFSNMGYDLNGALGVKMAQPESEVFAMVGDGGYLMLNSEVYTMVQDYQKVNIMLFDNSGWGCIEDLQNSHGGNSYGTQFTSRAADGTLTAPPLPIDFAMNAKSLGCAAYTCRNAEELKEALEDSKQYTDRPVLFDIKVAPGSMSPGYESWWRVGVAEVSENPDVEKSYEALVKEIAKTRDY